MMRRIAAGALFLSLWFSSAAWATFFMQADAHSPKLAAEISYRPDPGVSSSIESVMAAKDGWVSQAVQPFQGTGEPVRIWARFDVPEGERAPRVFIRASPWERVEYFIVRNGVVVSRHLAGSMVPLRERSSQISMTPTAFHAGLTLIELAPPATTTVYARIATDNQFLTLKALRFSLWEAKQVLEGELRARLLQGGFLGAVLVLVLYNLTLFLLNLHEKSYLYYVIGLIMGALVWGSMYGLTVEYLWPDHPHWDFYCFWTAVPILNAALPQFVRLYLNTDQHFPKADVLLKWASYGGLALLPGFYVPLAVGHPVSINAVLWVIVAASVFLVPLVIGVTFLALLRRHPLARLFFVAMLASGGGTAITFLPWLDIIPATEWALNASQLGSVVTGILLSVGLGFRMRQMQEELAEKHIKDALLRTEHEREKRELIEEQSRGLEAKVVERTAELVSAQAQSDALLANILPQAIIDELKAKGESEPRRHEESSILFTDFSAFTQTVATIPPKRLVQELDEIFRGFDDIIVANGLEKIKTIGDAYMAAGGLPVASEHHALRCVRAGLALVRFIEERNATAAIKWGLRVGVHSGAVVAGIVGKNKYAYDVWGDTVNIASRLESAGAVNKVNVSAYTYELVRGQFDCEYRGKFAAKGKGEIDMYFVLRERDAVDAAK